MAKASSLISHPSTWGQANSHKHRLPPIHHFHKTEQIRPKINIANETTTQQSQTTLLTLANVATSGAHTTTRHTNTSMPSTGKEFTQGPKVTPPRRSVNQRKTTIFLLYDNLFTFTKRHLRMMNVHVNRVDLSHMKKILTHIPAAKRV